ncbi:MAG TPA: hypothetical protein VK327_09155, partial [Candidatus Paceibacterota bacterium]|nr:hypothetical protein [Candidatus Paceibacterota bacterium]
MAGACKQSKPSFLWQGILLALPVVVFACMGMALLRRERMSVKQEATDNARVFAAQIANYIGPRLARRTEEQYRWAIQRREQEPPPFAMASFDSTGVGGAGEHTEYNVPMPQYRQLLRLLTNRGHGALAAVDQTPRLILSSEGKLLWPKLYPYLPQPSLASDSSDLKTEAGIPIPPLESLHRVRKLAGAQNEVAYAAASELASNAVAWPSFLTPLFLEEAKRAWPWPSPSGGESALDWWPQFWWGEEETRDMYYRLSENGALG